MSSMKSLKIICFASFQYNC